MSFIEDLNIKSIYSEDDFLIIEDTESTKRIKVQDLLKAVPIDIKINANNNIFLQSKDGTTIGDGATLPISATEGSGEVEMVFDGVWVKWRHKGEKNWINLFSVADIGGGSSSGGGGSSSTDISIKIGTVTTLPAGSEATAVIEEPTDNNFILSLGLPRGESITVDGDGVTAPTQVTTNIDKTSSKASVIARTNNIYIFGTLSSLSLLVNSTEVPLPDYNAVVNFRTRDNTPMKFSQSTSLYMVGDDCIFGAFIPRISTDYRIEISYGGTRLIGKVYSASYGYVANLSNFTGGSNIVGVAKSYIDSASDFCYGTNTILSSVSSKSDVTNSSGKYYIDDATLISLAYRYITYSDSKYLNWASSNNARTSNCSYAIELPRTSSEQARYCIQQGWILPKEYWGENFKNLQVGDIIFYSETPVNQVSTWGTRFMRIGHVALVSSIESGVIYVYDVSNDTNVNGLRKVALSNTSTEKISLISRPQLTASSSGGGGWDIGDDPTETPTENLLENGNISLSTGANVDSNNYVRNKGYINLGNVKGIKLKLKNKNMVIANVLYYNSSNGLLSYKSVGDTIFDELVPAEAKKVRFTFRKTDNSAIQSYEVDYNISYVMSDNVEVVPTPSNISFKDFPRVTGKITNQYQLVAKLNEIVQDHETMYVYGAVGQKLTSALIANRASAYPWFYTSSRMEAYRKAIATGKLIWSFDCVNLIKSVLWGWNADTTQNLGGAVYGSNGVQDVNADGCIAVCKDVKSYNSSNGDSWEDIQLGEAVWVKGHIGVYVGEGLVIECTPSWKNKVQITGLGNNPFKKSYNGVSRTWSKHGKLPWITYLSECPWTKTESGTVELKGKTYKTHISTYYPTSSKSDKTSISEAKKILTNLNIGTALNSSNYTNTLQWSSLINEIAPKFGIDPAIVTMVIAAESGGNPTAGSPSSSSGYGLMQVERSVFVKGYKNPYSGKVNSGVQTIKYLDGTTKQVTLSMSTLNGSTDSGRRLQLEFGCSELRQQAKKHYWNIIHSLVAYNMGEGALNFICSKYVCDKYGYTLVNSGSLSKQNSQVQEKVKEIFKNGDLGYLTYRQWYHDTGHTLLRSGPGTAKNVELYLRFYKIENDQLPYFYDDDNVKKEFQDIITVSTSSTSSSTVDAMGNECIGYPNELICAAPDSIPLGSKVFLQGTNTELDGKIFTVMDRCEETDDTLNIKICMQDKQTADAYDELNAVALVGDIVNNNKIVITTNGVNIRKGESTSYDIIGQAVNGCHFTWLGTCSNGWNKIDFKGKEAYVSGLYSEVREVS